MDQLRESNTIRAKEINSVIRRVFFASRLWGMLTFSPTYNDRSEIVDIHFSLFDKFHAVVAFSIYSYLTYFSLMVEKPPNASVLFHSIGTTNIAGSLSVGAFNVISDNLNRRKLLAIIRNFYYFDNEIATFGAFIDYKRHKKIVNYCYLASLLTTFVFIIITTFFYSKISQQSTEAIVVFVAYIGQNTATSTIAWIYAFLLMSIYFRYRQLNMLFR